jgi:hypothetical protein
MNGTISVTEEVSIDSNEDLCIGSRCGSDPGDAPPSQYYGEDGVLDGPVTFLGASGDERGIVAQGDICFGTC